MRKREEEIIKLTKEQKEIAVYKIKEYLQDNFDLEMGSLPTEIFLDYLTKEVGIYYYNKGIADAYEYISEKAEEMSLLIKEE